MNVHWTCDSPSHYNDVLFRALHESNLANFLVHFRRASLASHPWRVPLRAGYCSRIQTPLFGIDWTLAALPFRDKQALFLLGGWNTPTAILLVVICAVLRRPFAIWTDTPDESRERNLLASFFRRQLLEFGFRRATAVLGTGSAAMAALARMGVMPTILVNFPYWIDVDVFQRRSEIWANHARPIKFLSSGRMQNRSKGHDIAIRSLAAVARRVKSFRFIYEIAGAGPDAGALRALAEELNVGENVVFLGWLEPAEVADAMCRGDILLHPSPTQEPYGVAVIEGMAAGMVVLASDVTGAALDRIQHGVNGFIHHAGNFEELADQIAALVLTSHPLGQIGASARYTSEQWPVARGVYEIRLLLHSRSEETLS